MASSLPVNDGSQHWPGGDAPSLFWPVGRGCRLAIGGQERISAGCGLLITAGRSFAACSASSAQLVKGGLPAETGGRLVGPSGQLQRPDGQ